MYLSKSRCRALHKSQPAKQA